MDDQQAKALKRLQNRQSARRGLELARATRQRNIELYGLPHGLHPDNKKRNEEAKAARAQPLKEVAEEEIRLQLKHRDPKVRANAARLALELDVGKFRGKDSEQPLRRIVFETVALAPPGFEPPPGPPPILPG